MTFGRAHFLLEPGRYPIYGTLYNTDGFLGVDALGRQSVDNTFKPCA